LQKSAKKQQVYGKLHPDYEDIRVIVSTKERPEAAVASSKYVRPLYFSASIILPGFISILVLEKRTTPLEKRITP
jgi:hypothetical protein